MNRRYVVLLWIMASFLCLPLTALAGQGGIAASIATPITPRSAALAADNGWSHDRTKDISPPALSWSYSSANEWPEIAGAIDPRGRARRRSCLKGALIGAGVGGGFVYLFALTAAEGNGLFPTARERTILFGAVGLGALIGCAFSNP
jgi:hypothetical protein